MKSHYITTNMADGTGELLAVNFETRRIAVSWGSGWVSTTSVYQRFDDRWGGHWRFVFCPRGRELACVAGQCGEAERRMSELEVSVASRGPSLDDFKQWLISEAFKLERDYKARAAEAAELRELAKADGDWGQARQDRWRELAYDADLVTRIRNLAFSPARLRALAAWLAQRSLLHGEDLFAFGGQYGGDLSCVPYPADVDGLVYVCLELDLVKPYDYDPRPGGSVGETDGLLKPKQQTAWRKHGRWPWPALHAPIGMQLWSFARGPRYRELADVLPQG